MEHGQIFMCGAWADGNVLNRADIHVLNRADGHVLSMGRYSCVEHGQIFMC